MANQWRLIFEDDFTGSVLDASKWVRQFPWGNTSTSTPDLIYQDANVTISNSQLHLTAIREVVGAYNYTSGMVSTSAFEDLGDDEADYRYRFNYGRIAARIKCPVGVGLTPALWWLRPSGIWPPEIDVMEMFDDGTAETRRRVAQHYHYRNSAGAHVDDGGYTDIPSAQPDMTGDFHEYEVRWTPRRIAWYVDGQQYLATRADFTGENVTSRLGYLLLNLQVGLVGDPTNTTLPVTMSVDWVRVYQLEDMAQYEYPVGITAGGLIVPPTARRAEMQVRNSGVLFTRDGTTPTATKGHRADLGDIILLESRDELNKFQAIRQGSADGALDIQFFEDVKG